MQQSKVWYGEEQLSFAIPETHSLGVFSSKVDPPYLNGENLTSMIRRKMSSPDVVQTISEAKKVCIIVDDNTRPTPTKLLLPLLIQEIEKQTLHDVHIDILIALGVHKKLNQTETIDLLGEEICGQYTVHNHEAFNKHEQVFLKVTGRGTPVWVNKLAYEADVRILTGMIKPHNQAGYTGGGKAILPGVCGVETILANHSFAYMSDPRSCMGILEGNPIRQDINEAFEMIGPSILCNVVMDRSHRIIDLLVGTEVIKTHAQGAEIYDSIGRYKVSEKADICICGTPSPIDMNFYQMLNSLSAPHRLPTPVVKEGGTIVVCGRAVEGISDGDFFNALSEMKREELRKEVFSSSSQFIERPALQIFLECETHYRIVVCTEEQNLPLFEKMNIEAVAVKDSSRLIESLLESSEGISRVLILSDAPYAITHYRT